MIHVTRILVALCVFSLGFAHQNADEEVSKFAAARAPFAADHEPQDAYIKRFSMNYLDTLDATHPSSWNSRLSRPTEKRFSMNYLDTLDAADPKGWYSKIRATGGSRFINGRGKRFSMNFLDTLDNADPTSWYNRLRQTSKAKRFSMNYLDTLDSSDPNGWSSYRARPKRFSMNFRDTIEASDPRSWDNLKVRGLRGGRGRNADMSSKRSDAVAAAANAEALVKSIEVMASFMGDKYGWGYVCGQKDLRDLLDMRLFLKSIINQQQQQKSIYRDPLDCSNLST